MSLRYVVKMRRATGIFLLTVRTSFDAKIYGGSRKEEEEVELMPVEEARKGGIIARHVT